MFTGAKTWCFYFLVLYFCLCYWGNFILPFTDFVCSFFFLTVQTCIYLDFVFKISDVSFSSVKRFTGWSDILRSLAGIMDFHKQKLHWCIVEFESIFAAFSLLSPLSFLSTQEVFSFCYSRVNLCICTCLFYECNILLSVPQRLLKSFNQLRHSLCVISKVNFVYQNLTREKNDNCDIKAMCNILLWVGIFIKLK